MKKTVCLILVFLLSCSLSGCKKESEKFTDYSFDYFDTATSIIGYETDEEIFKENCDRIKEKLGEYHSLYTAYSRYNDLNNIYSVNNSRDSLEVDERITEMLEFAVSMHKKTNGYINVAMGSVLSIWHDYRENGLNNPEDAKLPDMNSLTQANMHTDINDLIIEGNTVFLRDSEMSLDVGAVAKGYATEQIALWMEEEGMTGYLLNVGGNIRTVGQRPDGEKWQIGLENPDRESSQAYIEYLEIDEMSIVTSGSYQRFYTVDGVNYHHIIDKDTLMPAVGYKMVSVISKSSAVGDALSTALFCMEYDEGRELVESFEDTYVMWVTEKGEKLYSKGFEKFIKIMEN